MVAARAVPRVRRAVVTEARSTCNDSLLSGAGASPYLQVRAIYIQVSQSVISAHISEGGGWDVRARDHTLAASGRWVAFGTSEDERLGTRWCTDGAGRHGTPKVACISFNQTLFWYVSSMRRAHPTTLRGMSVTPPIR